MTGEMLKPFDANKGEKFWKDKIGATGDRIFGDESYLIRPNYPNFFKLKDKIKKFLPDAEVEPFDVYQGPYIDVKIGSCKIWKRVEEEPCETCGTLIAQPPKWELDCGSLVNKGLFGTSKPFEDYNDGGEDILAKLKEMKKERDIELEARKRWRQIN